MKQRQTFAFRMKSVYLFSFNYLFIYHFIINWYKLQDNSF